MSNKLSTKQLEKYRAKLSPCFADYLMPVERQTILLNAFPDQDFIDTIDYNQPAFTFIIHVINTLWEFGELKSGKKAIDILVENCGQRWFDSEKSPQVRSLAALHNLGKLNIPKNFINYEEQLENLKTYLRDREANVVIICGFSGTGKTTLASKLADAWLNRNFGHIKWIENVGNAGSIQILDSLLRALGRTEEANKLYDKEDDYIEFTSSLLERDETSLVILDGALNERTVEDIVKVVAGAGKSLLITSRLHFIQLDGYKNIRRIDLDDSETAKFSPAHALALLNHHAKRQFELEKASGVLQRLDYNPYLIKLAGRRIRYNATLAELDALTLKDISETGKGQLSIVINQNLKDIKKRIEFSENAYTAFGIIPAGTITFELLNDFVKSEADHSREQIGSSLYWLENYGMIDRLSFDENIDQWRAHTFIMKEAYQRIPDPLDRELKLVQATASYVCKYVREFARLAAEQSNIFEIIKRASQRSDWDENTKLQKEINQTVLDLIDDDGYLISRNDLSSARLFIDIALKAVEKLGEGYLRDKARHLKNKAIVLWKLRKTEGDQLASEALKIARELSDPHLESRILGNIGHMLLKRDKHLPRIAYSRKALAVLEPNLPNIADLDERQKAKEWVAALNGNLGVFYDDLAYDLIKASPAERKKMLEYLLETKIFSLDEKVDADQDLVNQIVSVIQAEDFEQAFNIFLTEWLEQATEWLTQAKDYFKNKKHTSRYLKFLHGLANHLVSRGKFSGNIQHYEEAIKLYKEEFRVGSDIDKAHALGGLVDVYLAQGNTERATQYLFGASEESNLDPPPGDGVIQLGKDTKDIDLLEACIEQLKVWFYAE